MEYNRKVPAGCHAHPALLEEVDRVQRTYDEMTDEQLVEQYMAGDAAGMEVLYNRFFDRIYRLAYSKLLNDQDAQDAVSAVFLKLVRSIDSFRGESKLSTWIYTVANNAIMDMIRRRRPTLSIHSAIETDDGDTIVRELEDDAPGPEQLAVDDDFARFVYSKLDELPPAQRAVIELRYFMELSYQDIADRLGIELGTVKSRINRAVAALRTIVNRDEVSADARG
jgi:RNA polymerase sigma-70 factor (ECF subfamily)